MATEFGSRKGFCLSIPILQQYFRKYDRKEPHLQLTWQF
jgi:hypothetical protein